MSEIPADIEVAVEELLGAAWDGDQYTFLADRIARATLAERKRCAEVARKEGEGFRDHNLPQAAMGAFQAAKAIEAGQ